MKFWQWFIFSRNPALAKFINPWSLLFIILSGLLSTLLPYTLKDIATTLLLPLAGILVGLSFSWAASAHTLLQTNQIKRFLKTQGQGIEEYVYTYQMAVLFILITCVCWGIAALGVYDLDNFKQIGFRYSLAYFDLSNVFSWLIKTFHWTIACIALRECWQVVSATSIFLIAQVKITDQENKFKQKPNQKQVGLNKGD